MRITDSRVNENKTKIKTGSRFYRYNVFRYKFIFTRRLIQYLTIPLTNISEKLFTQMKMAGGYE